jgi:uncharacterized protein (TIGR00661 family)
MARILYGVMGDAYGHVSRSHAIAQSLPEHEFLFLGGGAVHTLKKAGYNVEDLPMASTLYRESRIDLYATGVNAAKVFLRRNRTIQRVEAIIHEFDPQLIISDYEFFTPLAARKTDRLCISLDHQHILTHFSYEPPRDERLSRMLTTLSIKYLYSSAQKFYVISFFNLEALDPDTTVCLPPVLRHAVKEYESVINDHVVVYLSAETFTNLVPQMKKTKYRYHVYGLGARQNDGNMFFKGRSTHDFLEDLASCKFVISTGGHSLISEALYFGKPIMCFPIEFAYEQFINAHFVDVLGFGRKCRGRQDFSSRLNSFELDLENIRNRIQKNRIFGNDVVADKLRIELGQSIGHRKN